MTAGESKRVEIYGSLDRAADGSGVVRMECRLDTGIDTVWSAVAEPSGRSGWMGEAKGKYEKERCFVSASLRLDGKGRYTSTLARRPRDCS